MTTAEESKLGPCTLTIDIGGTGIKMLRLDANGRPLGERDRELTPKPSTPEAVLALIEKMLEKQGEFDRVSVGFPGIVKRGVIFSAPNLGPKEWPGTDLESAIAALTKRPTRVLNDADLLGYGAIDGQGVELVITLGTGFGSALFFEGQLVPNLELGHHPLAEGQSYEDLIRDSELHRIGAEAWRERMALAFRTMAPIFNFDVLHVGGGNIHHLDSSSLPSYVRLFPPEKGMAGGVRLWDVSAARSL